MVDVGGRAHGMPAREKQKTNRSFATMTSLSTASRVPHEIDVAVTAAVLPRVLTSDVQMPPPQYKGGVARSEKHSLFSETRILSVKFRHPLKQHLSASVTVELILA